MTPLLSETTISRALHRVTSTYTRYLWNIIHRSQLLQINWLFARSNQTHQQPCSQLRINRKFSRSQPLLSQPRASASSLRRAAPFSLTECSYPSAGSISLRENGAAPTHKFTPSRVSDHKLKMNCSVHKAAYTPSPCPCPFLSIVLHLFPLFLHHSSAPKNWLGYW